MSSKMIIAALAATASLSFHVPSRADESQMANSQGAQQYQTRVTGYTLPIDAGAVSLIYRSGGFGHNANLFEWFDSTTQESKARLVTYGGVGNSAVGISAASPQTLIPATESGANSAGSIAATEAGDVGNASSFATASAMNAVDITDTLKQGDVSTGSFWWNDDNKASEQFKNDQWMVRASWRRSHQEIQNGLNKVSELSKSPPNYAVSANLPLVDIENDVQNCLSMAALLLHSSGIPYFNKVFILSPNVWKPQGDLK